MSKSKRSPACQAFVETHIELLLDRARQIGLIEEPPAQLATFEPRGETWTEKRLEGYLHSQRTINDCWPRLAQACVAMRKPKQTILEIVEQSPHLFRLEKSTKAQRAWDKKNNLRTTSQLVVLAYWSDHEPEIQQD